MDYSFTAPALVFPAISLLMLAYTQRFLTLSELTRNLHKRYLDSNKQDHSAKSQIANLSLRIKIIRYTQLFGALAFTLATMAMIMYLVINPTVSLVIFILSLLSLLISLALLMVELQISVNAIHIQLDEMKA